MIIRNEQMEVLDKATQRVFELDLAERCASAAPALCESAGGDSVLRLVHMGVERAGAHGFTLRGPVRMYVDLMLWFGCDFDSDPQLEWAPKALASGLEEDQMSRAKALHQAAQPYTELVIGLKREHAIAALGRLGRIPASGWPKFGDSFEEGLMRLLSMLYPEKFEYAGAPALRPMIRRAAQTSAGFGVRLEMAVALLTTLMFVFGHGVATDPLYPWVAAALGDANTPNPPDRLAKLYESMSKFAVRVQRDFEG